MRVPTVIALVLMLLTLAETQSVNHPDHVLVPVRLMDVIDGDTIRVWFDQKQETIRYESVEAPELTDPAGYESRRIHEEIVTGKDLWLDCARDPQGNLIRDTRGRVLGYLFLGKDAKDCVNVELVRQGAARVGVRAVGDDTPSDSFPLKHVVLLIGAQVEAATNRRGWWGKGDPYVQSDFVICFIQFWGRDEVVWLLNRGESPLNLVSDYKLTDATRKAPFLCGRQIPVPVCNLPQGGILRVHSGPAAKAVPMKCGASFVDVVWKGQRVWNNDHDMAHLHDPSGKIIYVYEYKAASG